MMRGANPGTVNEYQPAFNSWIEYRITTLNNLSEEEEILAHMYLTDCDSDEGVAIVMDYVVWATEVQVKKIPGRTVDRYLTGIRYLLKPELHRSCHYIFDDECFTLLRKGLRAEVIESIIDSDEEGSTASSKPTKVQKIKVDIPSIKLPVVAEQYDYLRKTMWEDPEATIDDNMTYIACVSAGNVVLRIGEIAYVGPYYKRDPIKNIMVHTKLDHRLMLSQGSFATPDGTRFSYEDYVNHPEPWP
jgi:hypothetical protein